MNNISGPDQVETPTRTSPNTTRESIEPTTAFIDAESRMEGGMDETTSPQQGNQLHASSASPTTPNTTSNILHLSTNSLNIIWALTMLCFLAGMGMQLSLLSINTSLRMMNRKHWGCGQIVAVMIWVPPLLEYAYNELEMALGWDQKAT